MADPYVPKFCKFPEDSSWAISWVELGFGVCARACVIDGVSAPYHPREGPALFRDRSDGQVLVDEFVKALSHAPLALRAELVLAEAQKKIHDLSGVFAPSFLETQSVPPGASFAYVQIDWRGITLFTAGDCLVVWEDADGKRYGIPNQSYEYNRAVEGRFREIRAEHPDLFDAWDIHLREVVPYKANRLNRPGGIAEMNGDPNIIDCWKSFVLQTGVRRMILGTDGVFPGDLTRNPGNLAEYVFTLYDQGGIPAIIASTKALEQKEKNTSWVPDDGHTEATAIAIEL
ncbi:MAG: hypothetical protein HYT50_02115 [Candidatus Wildermuthbacteria bacterium]|nr:hypothetical protein [Candidatus Wildermuthbacteria bacterium]